MVRRAIMMFGPPGVGKGTQAVRLAEENPDDFFAMSTGEMFRGLDPSTDIGARIKALIDGGNYVPDDLTIELFDETMERYIAEGKYDPAVHRVILDGIPRTVPQIAPMMRRYKIEDVLYLDAPTSILVERIKERGKISGRADDLDENIITHRIGTYRNKTLSMIYEFPSGAVKRIDASGSRDEVFQLVLSEVYKKIK